jgi:ELWxxDGT repeat protein
VADEGVNVRKLWKSYGDTAYKVHVPSILNAATISQREVIGSKMYFNANSPTVGSEIWVAQDDTVILLKDIYPGTKSSNPLDLEAVGDVLYFAADDGITGKEIWMVLGNSVFLVKDIVPGLATSAPFNLIAVNDAIYFSADNITHGRELWKVRAPLFLLMDTIACQSYQFGNSYLTQSGRYFDTLISSNNRDSIIILDLIINTLNTDLSQNNLVLTALENNADYQWLNCDQAYATIAGATNKVYTTISSGSYAVEIKKNGCIDTSDCVVVKLTGIDSQEKPKKMTVYPNPAKTSLFIELNGRINETHTIEIYDINGQLIRSVTPKGKLSEIQVGDLARGLYILKVASINEFKFYKILLN